jgi:hypothetical protein
MVGMGNGEQVQMIRFICGCVWDTLVCILIICIIAIPMLQVFVLALNSKPITDETTYVVVCAVASLECIVICWSI